MIGNIFSKLSRTTKVFVNKRKFCSSLEAIPEAYKDVVEFSFYRNFTDGDRALGVRIEGFRDEISKGEDGAVIHTFGSPHSNTELFDDSGRVRPGVYKPSKARGVAKTGTRVFGGIQLKKLIEAYGTARIFELGTNTGLSGAYFLSADNTTELVTVEGSEELCRIAAKNLSRIGSNYSIKNLMFQDAIEELTKDGSRFDIAFLDGQHEKQATLHYTDLLMPILKSGGMIIYDDIYWSEDMNSAWRELIDRDYFGTSFDLGNRGVCILDSQTQAKRHYNLCNYIGMPHIHRSGW